MFQCERVGCEVTRKLACPKCQNDTFRLTLSERQEISQARSQAAKMTIVTFLWVTCSKCGWNQPLTRAEGG